MHEMGYCTGVLEAVERRAAGRRVARVGVHVGALHRISPAAFEQSFQMVAAGGVADGAPTDVEIVPSTAACRACAHTFTTPDPGPHCPRCGATDVETTGGDEIVLAWLEFAEPEQPAAAGSASCGCACSASGSQERQPVEAVPAAGRPHAAAAGEDR